MKPGPDSTKQVSWLVFFFSCFVGCQVGSYNILVIVIEIDLCYVMHLPCAHNVGTKYFYTALWFWMQPSGVQKKSDEHYPGGR